MAAPAAPRIRAHGNGTGERVLVRWQPVANATDYNLYVQEAGGTRGIDSQYEDDDVGPDGWFHVYTYDLAGVVNVDVTALNVGAEESIPSNVVQSILKGPSPDHEQTDALNHASRLV